MKAMLRPLILIPFLAACALAQTGFTTHSMTLPGGQDSLRVADFNRDGRLDLLLFGGGHAAVAFGNGNGTFGTPVTIDSSILNMLNAQVGDFNGDGIPDFVGCGTDQFENPHLKIYLNNGHGQFTVSTDVAVGSCDWIAVGDVNNDGKLDVVTHGITTRFGDGAGHFTKLVSQTPNVNPRINTAIKGCFVGGLIGAHFVTSTNFSLLLSGICNNPPGQPTIDFGTLFLAQSLGNGTWSLSEIREQDVTWQFTGNAIDVNHDGLPDALLIHRFDKIGQTQVLFSLDYLRNNGHGSFSFATVFTVNDTNNPADNTHVLSGTAGDFDLDGAPDLAAGYEITGSENIAIIDDQSGVFKISQHFPVPGRVFSMISADFNRDGKPDLAAIAINPSTLKATLLVFTKN